MQINELIEYCQENLRTQIFDFRGNQGEIFRNNIIKKRVYRIKESLSWDVPENGHDIHDIYNINDREKLYFKKPGKEYPNKNENDTTPMKSSLNDVLQFKEIWGKLIRLSINEKQLFDIYSTLLYRLAFLMDHTVENGKCRYSPTDEINTILSEIGEHIDAYLSPLNSRTFLLYLDLIGWNEDVKYHTMRTLHDKKAIFATDKDTFYNCHIDAEQNLIMDSMNNPKQNSHNKADVSFYFMTGCINTIISAIVVSYNFYDMFHKIRERNDFPENVIIGFLKDSQNLSRSGTSSLSRENAIEWMRPYTY